MAKVPPKSEITFKYFKLLYDTDKDSVLAVLKESKPYIENIIKHEFTPFWLNVNGPRQFDSYTFPFKNTWIRVRVYKGKLECEVQIRSQDFDKKCLEIRNSFFPLRKDGTSNTVCTVLNHVHKKSLIKEVFNFKIINPDFDVENVADGLGCLIDTKIKNSVEELNRFGIHTTMSCQGHKDALAYPWIDITMVSLPTFLMMMKSIGDEYLNMRLIDYVEDFRLYAPEGLSLLEGQKLFNRFANILKKREVR